jgi:hypothetical protein
MAPTYITVAGTRAGEGIIITRERTESVNPLNMAATAGKPLVQTNMDHFHVESLSEEFDWQDICNSRFRFGVAKAALEKPNITEEEVWNILSTPPCLAHDTIYTVSMNPSTGYYVTRVSVTNSERRQAKRLWGKLVDKINLDLSEKRSEITAGEISSRF